MSQSNNQPPPAELKAFTVLRGRPSLYLIIWEPLALKHLWQVQSALGDQQFEEIDFVIHSGGGDINVAYQMIELIRLHTESLFACVPLVAKSAATLLCLGTDGIFLDKLAQLGPLDTQVYEEKKDGRGDFTSALNPFKTLEQLQKFSLETLDLAVKMITRRSGLDLDECLKYATSFVGFTSGPLLAKLDTEKLGEYSRALAVGWEYGDRLLRRFSDWDEDRRIAVLDELVHGYPSHDYIIDYHELQELGFNVRLFDDKERRAVDRIVKRIKPHTPLVLFVTPSAPTRKTKSKDTKETSP